MATKWLRLATLYWQPAPFLYRVIQYSPTLLDSHPTDLCFVRANFVTANRPPAHIRSEEKAVNAHCHHSEHQLRKPEKNVATVQNGMSSYAYRVCYTGPLHVIRNCRGQMCFVIQNVSNFRKLIRCIYRTLCNNPRGAWGSALYSNTLLFLQSNLRIFTLSGINKDHKQYYSLFIYCNNKLLEFSVFSAFRISDIGIGDLYYGEGRGYWLEASNEFKWIWMN